MLLKIMRFRIEIYDLENQVTDWYLFCCQAFQKPEPIPSHIYQAGYYLKRNYSG